MMSGGKAKSKKCHASIMLNLEAKSKHELQGKIIKLVRQSKGISQNDLAELIQVSRPTISAIEKRGADSLQIFAIADALGVDVRIFAVE